MSVIRKLVKSKMAPAPVGPYSQAVIVGNTMYMSGIIGLDPISGKMVTGGVEAETERIMKSMQAIVDEAGVSLANVVKTTILLADITDWPVVNIIYGKYFKQHYPSRAAYQVAALPLGARVEVEGIAIVAPIQDE